METVSKMKYSRTDRLVLGIFVFTGICGNFRICHIVSSVSDVEKRICRKKIF